MPPATTVYIGGATTTETATTTRLQTTGASPPVQPAAGVTVHNLYIFGNEWYSVAEIDGIKTMLTPATATAGNELAQRRSVGWKFFSKALITNENFGVRIESASAND